MTDDLALLERYKHKVKTAVAWAMKRNSENIVGWDDLEAYATERLLLFGRGIAWSASDKIRPTDDEDMDRYVQVALSHDLIDYIRECLQQRGDSYLDMKYNYKITYSEAQALQEAIGKDQQWAFTKLNALKLTPAQLQSLMACTDPYSWEYMEWIGAEKANGMYYTDEVPESAEDEYDIIRNEAVTELIDEQYPLLVMHYDSGLSERDIAAIKRKSQPTIHRHIKKEERQFNLYGVFDVDSDIKVKVATSNVWNELTSYLTSSGLVLEGDETLDEVREAASYLYESKGAGTRHGIYLNRETYRPVSNKKPCGCDPINGTGPCSECVVPEPEYKPRRSYQLLVEIENTDNEMADGKRIDYEQEVRDLDAEYYPIEDDDE